MHDSEHGDDRRDAASPPDPPVVDVRDWPPRSRTDEAREELDREVGTLGIGGASPGAQAAEIEREDEGSAGE